MIYGFWMGYKKDIKVYPLLKASDSSFYKLGLFYGGLTFKTISDSNAVFASTILAPTYSNAKSLKFESTPAPFSTFTVNPYLTSLETASGEHATLFSPGYTSFGTPLIKFIVPIDSFLISKEQKLCFGNPVIVFS